MYKKLKIALLLFYFLNFILSMIRGRVAWIFTDPFIRILLGLYVVTTWLLSIFSFGIWSPKGWTPEEAIEKSRVLALKCNITETETRDRLHEEAMKRSLKDLDKSDLYFLGRITPVGRLVAKKLMVETFHRLFPQASSFALPAKTVWIVSLPRTGSTWMHQMCGMNRASRTMKSWELKMPVPWSIDCGPSVEERKGFVKKQMEFFYKYFPKFKEIHFVKYDEPDECVNGFVDCVFPEHFSWGAANMEETYQWYTSTDMSRQYRHYKMLLQAVMYEESVLNQPQAYESLILKSPHHILKLKDIAKVFPNSVFVWLHRDVAEVVGSCCSMNQTFLESVCPHYFDVEILAKRTATRLANAVTIGMRDRDHLELSWPEIQFVDIMYSDLKSDPASTIKQAFDSVNISCTDEFLEQIRSQHTRPSNSSSKTKHSIESFGLSNEWLDELFQEYRDRFKL